MTIELHLSFVAGDKKSLRINLMTLYKFSREASFPKRGVLRGILGGKKMKLEREL
jgi:hypothetical protein